MSPTALLIVAGGRTCAIPLPHVIEIMRPLPITPIIQAPPFTLGAAVVRGSAVPVVDVAAMLGAAAGAVGRFVSVRAGERRAVLAVESVAGLASFAPAEFEALPPLLSEPSQPDVIAALVSRDRELYLVLDAARLVPDGIERNIA